MFGQLNFQLVKIVVYCVVIGVIVALLFVSLKINQKVSVISIIDWPILVVCALIGVLFQLLRSPMFLTSVCFVYALLAVAKQSQGSKPGVFIV